jgi:hypothetical protein
MIGKDEKKVFVWYKAKGFILAILNSKRLTMKLKEERKGKKDWKKFRHF